MLLIPAVKLKCNLSIYCGDIWIQALVLVTLNNTEAFRMEDLVLTQCSESRYQCFLPVVWEWALPWKELSHAAALSVVYALKSAMSAWHLRQQSPWKWVFLGEFEDQCLFWVCLEGENAVGLPPLALCLGLPLDYQREQSDWIHNAVTGCTITGATSKTFWKHCSLSLPCLEPNDPDMDWGPVCCQCFTEVLCAELLGVQEPVWRGNRPVYSSCKLVFIFMCFFIFIFIFFLVVL